MSFTNKLYLQTFIITLNSYKIKILTEDIFNRDCLMKLGWTINGMDGQILTRR
jgi:hypothetical protein